MNELTGKPEPVSSIYVHFPFCEAKCHYCDFFSLPAAQIKSAERARIYSAIDSELTFFRSQLSTSLKTIFLGGGTPSLVPVDVIRSLMDKLGHAPDTEITMEANPSSIDLNAAHAWRSAGINRISMGTQALNDDRLAWLGRVHTKSEVFEALETLFQAGFERVNTDYIVGVPGQTVVMIESELNELLSRFPHIQHISAYLLTLKPSNPKFDQLPCEDEQLAHLRSVSAVLKNFGFDQYEISNFARKGARALHNENYWLGGGYLGIGPSAHSYCPIRRIRTKNWASLGKYCDLIEQGTAPVEWTETLTLEQERLEYLMLRLRRSAGVNFQEYRARFHRDLYAEQKTWIDLWQTKGLCTVGDSLKLTADGFFLSDQILNNLS
ncbi:MAG: radical SAM family heme chaperone HemW [Deltaproteobacteria bacterium]|nr:radical SAM family heme chaperone HemW [Deltaproteobacteria bacterium]